MIAPAEAPMVAGVGCATMHPISMKIATQQIENGICG
jgi:hypothetical protein